MSEQVQDGSAHAFELFEVLFATRGNTTLETARAYLEGNPSVAEDWKRTAAAAEDYMFRLMPVMVTMDQHRQMVSNALRKSKAEIEGLERAIVNLVLQMGQNAVAPPRIVHLGKVT